MYMMCVFCVFISRLGTDESDDLDSGGEEDNSTLSSAGGDSPATATAQLQQDKERSPVHKSSSETKEQDASLPGRETTTTAGNTRETAGGENVCEDSSTKCPTEQGTPTAENARNPTPEVSKDFMVISKLAPNKDIQYNLVKGQLFAKFWHAKMNVGHNMWTTSVETPIYIIQTTFLLIRQSFVPPILPAIW